MALSVSQQFVELRKFDAADFRSTHDLPAHIVHLITAICKEYVSGSHDKRAAIRSFVTVEIAFLFFLFSQEMAEKAVQQESEAYLKWSIVALLIENATFDWRDTLIALSKVFHSGQRLGLKAEQLVTSATGLADVTGLNIFREFAAREPAKRSIHTFGFTEGKNAEGLFAYVPIVPRGAKS